MFLALENKVGYPCTRTSSRKKGLHKILKTTSIDAYEESDVFRQRENFHFPFRSESEEELLHSNKSGEECSPGSLRPSKKKKKNYSFIYTKNAVWKSTHHYFKNGKFKQVSEFQQETTHFLRETVSTRYHKEDLEFFSFKGKGSHFPSQALVHKRNLCLAKGR